MKPSTELIRLVDKCLDQSLSPAEMVRLEQLLQHRHNLEYYLGMMELEAELPNALQKHAQPSSRPFPLRAIYTMAAAVIIFFCGLLIGQNTSSQTKLAQPSISITPPQGASITSMLGVTWDGQAPTSFKLSNQSQPLKINSGLIELTFDSGVRTLIEGPATLKVTGFNSASISNGKLVADVPKGAEGFSVNYPNGKIVDLGTEFAIHVPDNLQGAEVGVFRGEVEIHTDGLEKPLKITENHAVQQSNTSNSEFLSIPFEQDNYIRTLPSNEFSWKLSEVATSEPTILEFDVSHLVWKPGSYRSAIKYMLGTDALCIHKAELILDDQLISRDSHFGRTGNAFRTLKNLYTFTIPKDNFKKGKWIIRFTVTADTTDRGELGSFIPQSSGIVLFDEASLTDDDSMFVGAWEYSHDGQTLCRVFTPDHKAIYYINGEETAQFNHGTWSVKDGILTLTLPSAVLGKTTTLQENHIINEKGELVIINQPYRNARKIKN